MAPLRRAADTVGSELFTIVHKPEKASELTRKEMLLRLDSNQQPSGFREQIVH